MIFEAFIIIISLFAEQLAAQHCNYGDRGFRSVTCFRLNNPYLSRVPGVQTSKYYYDSFKCVNCALGIIQPNSFNVGTREKSTFRSMDLEQCGITEIKQHGFGYQALVRLNLRNNGIKFLYASNFVDLSPLEYLDLSSNLIQKLITNTFQGLNYLKVLDLENNSIASIESYAFRDLEELQVLNLKHNNFTVLHYGMFFGATNVKSLLFAFNSIREIDNQALSSLTSLEKLDLSNNRITSISQELHATIKQLKTLDFSYNRITDVNFTSVSLEELKLSNISLQSVEMQLKCNLPSLLLLDLQRNNVSTFNVQFFSQFPLLYHLNLANNTINRIDTSGKLQMRSLQRLNLSLNNITSFDCQTLLDYIPQLNNIDLKGNPLDCSRKHEIEEFFQTASVTVGLIKSSEKCSNDSMEIFTSTLPREKYTQSTLPTDVAVPSECHCVCPDAENGMLVVNVVMSIIIIVLLLFSMCMKCCCRPKDKYAVNSANLPLVNLSKE